MCRFALYLGPPITLDLLTTRPEYSIVRQSFKARMRVEPLNGDGFGLGWYVPEISPEPAVYRSIQPAWNNRNLLDLARVTRSPAVLAHVRAASAGLGVSETNCHPFSVGRLSFMHNGAVPEFLRLKRRFQERLSDEAFSTIQGTTDSEHVFALFRDKLAEQTAADATDAMADALAATIAEVIEMVQSSDTERNAFLNLAVSDGQRAVVSRYVTGDSEGASLFLHTGERYVCDDGQCRMIQSGGRRDAVLVASEPLTNEPGWEPVPRNHMLLIRPDHTIEFRELAAG